MVFEDIYLVAKLGRVSRFPRKSFFILLLTLLCSAAVEGGGGRVL
jgi:hypothetical protein